MLGAITLTLCLQPTAAPEPAIAEPVPPQPVLDARGPAEPVAPPEVTPPPEQDPFAAPAPAPIADPAPAPQNDPFGGSSGALAGPALDGYVRVQRPRGDGTWQLVISGVAFAGGVVTQLVDASVYRNSGTGVLERAFFGTTIILAATGANARARHDAYFDTALRMPVRSTRTWLALGATLTVLGVGAGVANEAMWWKCAIGDEGPYHTGGVSEFEEFSNRRRRPCNYNVGRGVLDGAVMATSAGLGMLIYALRYRHDARAYEGAKLVVAPSFSRGFRGLSLQGRF